MSIYEKLYPWQKKLIDKYSNRDSFGLFLDMGLGKTPLSLGFAEKNKCQKCIVITLNSKALENEFVNGSWLNWASKSNINYSFYNKKSKEEFKNNENSLFIINYESLFSRSKAKKSKCELKENILSFIRSCKDKNVAIIVDESHKLKDISSLQTLAVNKLKNNLKMVASNVYTYLLTGTPFTTGYIDLYSQLKILGYKETKGTFVDTFCIRGNLKGLLGWQQPIVGYKNLPLLYDTIHKFAITIKSEEVIDLPEKIFINHNISESDEFLLYFKEYINSNFLEKISKKLNIDISSFVQIDTLKKSKLVQNPFYRNIDFPSRDYLADTSGLAWLRARQLSIGFQGNAEKCIWYDKRRLSELKEFLSNNEDNYLLFYNFTPELVEIYDICKELKYNIDVYCGEVKSLTFYEKYESQSEEQRLTNKRNIIIANFASGSTGMNWQLYNKCIIFSLPLYKDYEQGLKRINRIGQKNTTFYHIFSQQNWLDKSMQESLDNCSDYSLKMFESDLLRVKSMIDSDVSG